MTNPDPSSHRGNAGDYDPACPCPACEKHRAKRGMPMLNPRGAVEGPGEQRPTVVGAEIR